MNKFNLGLHSALFSLDWSYYLDDMPPTEKLSELYKATPEDKETGEVLEREAAQKAADERDNQISNTKQELNTVVPDSTEAQRALDHDVDNLFGDSYTSLVLNQIYKRKRDAWLLNREEVVKIQKRLQENVKLWGVWEKNIRSWYKHLLKTLLDNKYFDNPSHKKEDAIRKMYIDKVESQYEKYVWNTRDEEFEKLKGKLFGKDMADYPANEVYRELNNTDISAEAQWGIQAYRVEAQNTANFKSNLDDVEGQKWGDKKRFLTRDLPNYLWETKDTSVFSKILQWTPIVSRSVERKSEEDKRWLWDFLDAVENISVEWEEKPELVLLDAFKDAQTNWTETQWKEKLNEKNIHVTSERGMRKVIEAGRFYSRTQRMNIPVEQQHNLYLSILGVIENEWWVDNAVAKFMDDVKAYQENKEAQKEKDNKQSADALKNLPDGSYLYNIANNFSKNFKSALNLAEMDMSNENRSVVDILSDINNDKKINFADNGATKTGFEFKRMVRTIGEKTAIENLLKEAALLNKTMQLGLSDEDLNYEEIQKWNKKLILLLQNIISQPWWGLYPLLMYGPDSAKAYKEAFDRLPKSKDDPAVQAAAENLLKDIKVEDFRNIEWVDWATDREWLRQAVAWRLFTEYVRGVWLGGTISFDEWVKWVSLHWWFDITEEHWLGAAVTLGYNPEIDLWKWRSITPGASFWLVPLFHTAAWWSVELAKKWIDDKSNAERIWIRWWFTRIFGISDVYSASIWWSRDKLAGIEGDRKNIESQFKNQIMVPLIETIADKLWNDKVLDLESEDGRVLSVVREAIEKQVDNVLETEGNSKLEQWDKEKLINNTIRFLSFFNKADLSNENLRTAIASKMAEQYAYAREDQRLNDIDGKAYLSGARIWFSWVQLWIYWVWVLHAWLSFTKHEKDISGDVAYWRYGAWWKEQFGDRSSWDEKMIKLLSNTLPDGKSIEWKDWCIVIKKNLFRDVYINQGMKWLIKKDESGNVLVHPESHIDFENIYRTSTESAKIYIWWYDQWKMVKLSEVDEDWFTDWDIDTSKLTGKENIFTKEILDRKLDELKGKSNNPDLKNYQFSDEFVSTLENGKKYRITLRQTPEGISTEKEEVTVWKGLTIEYLPLDKQQLVSKEATIIANDVYAEALKVTSNALYNISHDKSNRLNREYREFADYVKNQQYKEAKDTILAMLPKMDDYINQYQPRNNRVNFGKTESGDSEAVIILRELEWEELGKALMSINNVFARVLSVHGWTDWLYHFKIYNSTKGELVDRDMWSIVESRAKEISWKIDRSDLDDEVKLAYQNLITFAENHRKAHPDDFSDSSKKTKTYKNAIWINLWNAHAVENPLFNPEVYEGPEITNLDFEWADVLKKHALDVVINNSALMDPILKWLHFNSDAEIGELKYNEESWEFNLDINEKNVILKADMKIAYFAQCVNLMVVLDNIYAEIPWESVNVDFSASVTWDGNVIEWTLWKKFTRARTSGDAAFTVYEQEQPKPEEPEKKPDHTNWSDPRTWGKGNNDSTIPGQDWGKIDSWDKTTGDWDKTTGDWDKTTGDWDSLWTDWEKNGPSQGPNEDESWDL